jgi:hypothetical protein
MSSPRVYLGTVAVVPRSDIKRHLERPMFDGPSDPALQAHLESVLSLPRASEISQPDTADCGLDVFVAKHQSGEAFDVAAGDFGFPLFWRPAVEVSTRVYALRNKKPITTFHVTKRLSWSEYFNRLLSVRHLLSFSSPFTHQDMVELLDDALFETLTRVKAVV